MSQDQDPGRTRQIVAAFIVLAVLIGGSLWLAGALRSASKVQDCVASGRTNCAPMRD